MTSEFNREEIESFLKNAEEMVNDYDRDHGRVPTKLTLVEEECLLNQMESWINRSAPDPKVRREAIRTLGEKLHAKRYHSATTALILIAQNTQEVPEVRQACLDSFYEILGIPQHRRILKTVEEFFGE